MFFSKIPHHLDERLKETDRQLSLEAKGQGHTSQAEGLAGYQLTYPTAVRRRELLAAGRHFSAETCGKINSLFCDGEM